MREIRCRATHRAQVVSEPTTDGRIGEVRLCERRCVRVVRGEVHKKGVGIGARVCPDEAGCRRYVPAEQGGVLEFRT